MGEKRPRALIGSMREPARLFPGRSLLAKIRKHAEFTKYYRRLARAGLLRLLLLTLAHCSASALPCAGANCAAGDAQNAGEATVDSYITLDASELPTAATLTDLGSITTAASGLSAALPFDLAADTTAIQLEISGLQAWQLTGAELSGPAGQIVVAKTWLDLSAPQAVCTTCLNRVGTQPGQVVIAVPSGDAVAVQPGHWLLRVAAYERDSEGTFLGPRTGPVHVALARRHQSSTQAMSYQVDINLLFTGALGITAAIAPDFPRIQDALTTMKTLLAQANVQVATVRYTDVTAPALVIAHDTGSDSDIDALFASLPPQPPGINVVLVDQLFVRDASPSLAPVLGLSGGIPGPFTNHGPRAGVVVSLATGPGEDDDLGYTLAHELCHYLGLWHTVEQPVAGGTAVEDPIEDTQGNDTQNLMNWTHSPFGKGTLTAGQVRMVQRSPWLSPVPGGN